MEVGAVPDAVRNGVALLWASLVLTTVDTLVSGSFGAEDGVDLAFGAIYVATVAVNAWVIHSAFRRRNWARIILLIIIVAVISLSFFWPPEIGVDPWWSILLLGAATLADAVAMFCLFSRKANRWYRGLPYEGAF
jgi:hypothetical protein